MANKKNTFGEFVREKRLEAGFSLRKFCEIAKLDPSNWSKVERGRMPITNNRNKLEEIATLIGLKKGTDKYQEFFDLAYISRREIPEYLYSNEEVLSALPIFFRTAQGEKPSEEELNKIIDILKGR